MTGLLYRQWTGLRVRIGTNDAVAVLAGCEHDEKAALQSYQSALERLSEGTVRDIAERQMRGVGHNYDRVCICVRAQRQEPP